MGMRFKTVFRYHPLRPNFDPLSFCQCWVYGSTILVPRESSQPLKKTLPKIIQMKHQMSFAKTNTLSKQFQELLHATNR